MFSPHLSIRLCPSAFLFLFWLGSAADHRPHTPTTTPFQCIAVVFVVAVVAVVAIVAVKAVVAVVKVVVVIAVVVVKAVVAVMTIQAVWIPSNRFHPGDSIHQTDPRLVQKKIYTREGKELD